MTNCDQLAEFKNQNVGELIDYNVYTVEQYGQCELKLQALQTWVNSIVNRD